MNKNQRCCPAGVSGLLLACAVISGCATSARPAIAPAGPVEKPASTRPANDAPIQTGNVFLSIDTDTVNDAPAVAMVGDVVPDGSAETVLVQSETDIWQRIRSGYALVDYGHTRVEAERRWYARNANYLDRVAERAEPYLYHIVDEVEKRGMPLEIALLPIVESAFQPFAYSHGRAAGIWQFIPGTGRLYGLKQNWWYDGRRDIIASTDAALRYLQRLNEMFNGDWLLALAAYNSGEGTVGNAIKANVARNKPTDFWSLKLPEETSNYVPRLLAVASLIEQPEQYGITLRPIANEPYITTVDIGGQIDLALAADLAGVSLEKMYRLNPGFNRWATDPEGPHALVVPLDKADRFRTGLANLSPDKRIQWQLHRVRSGETLGQIAKQYDTTAQLLAEVNTLKGTTIRADQQILIPVATRSLASYGSGSPWRTARNGSTGNTKSGIDYIVQPGDTFWDIARRHKVSANQLASWNNMGLRETLRPGQKLVVRTQSSTAASKPTAPATQQRIQYTVRRGDSLAGISQKFNVTLHDLVRWNALDKRKHLQPGQKLVLLVDVTRQAENI